MKFLRLTLHPPPELRHPMARFLGDTDEVYAERLLGWTIPDDRDVWFLLFHAEGDLAAYREAVEDADVIEEYDLTRAGERSFYGYFVERIRPVEQRLLEAFADRELVIVPPVDFSPDGRPTYTIVGPARAQTEMIADLPDDYVADVERIGEFDHRYTSVAGRLTDRQREAVRVAVDLGYYEVPRKGTLAGVADRLDCSESGASKLLRRAEAAVMGAVLEG